jgi:hypothetical protein
MQHQLQLQYFVLRYVPNVVSGNSINIGVVMVALGGADFGQVRFLNDWTPVLRFDPNADMDFLNAFARDIGEQLGDPEKREHILQHMNESFSNSIQLSTPQICVSEDPSAELEQLSAQYLPSAAGSDWPTT